MTAETTVLRGEARQSIAPLRRLLSPVLVAREHEYSTLAYLATHPPAVAFIQGEAGVGKTRLVAEVVRSTDLAGRRCLVGRCNELREPLTLGPVVDALRDLGSLPERRTLSPLTGVLRSLLPEMRDRLPPIPPELVEQRPDRPLLFRAAAEILAKLGPSLLVLEDLHWSDDATVDFLRFLSSRLPPTLSVLLTWRPEDLPPESSLRGMQARVPPETLAAGIDVGPLDVCQVRTLVSAILGSSVSEEFAAYMHERSSGLPFAVEELVGLVQERRDLIRRKGRWLRRSLRDIQVPRAISESILERVSRLRPDARRMVDSAAVLGLPSDEALLTAVSGLDPGTASEALAEALTHAVLFKMGDGHYGLRHALATEAVCQAIPDPRRRDLHRRAAMALRATDESPLGRLVHHLREAGELHQAADIAELAADRASSLGDDVQAALLLDETLRTPGIDAAQRLRLSKKLAVAAQHGFSHYPEAVSALRMALGSTALSAIDRGEVRLLLAQLLHSTGEAAEGHREAAEAVKDLRRRPELAINGMLHLATPCTVETPIRENLRWLERALETCRDLGAGHVTPEVAITQACVLLEVGDPRGWGLAEQVIEAARARSESKEAAPGFAWTLQAIAGSCLAVGRYAAADELLSEASAISAGLVSPSLEIGLETSRLVLRWATGQWDGLEQAAADHADVHRDIPWVWIPSTLVEAALALVHGNLDHALTRAQGAHEMSTTCGVLRGASWSASLLGRCRLLMGDAVGAQREALRGLDLVVAKGIWASTGWTVPVAIEALTVDGKVDVATELVSRFGDGLRGCDAPLAETALWLCRAIAAQASGDVATASEAFSQASGAAEGLPDPHAAALAAGRGGICRLDAGDREGSGEALRALERLTALGASLDAARLRQELRQRGVLVPATGKRGRRGYGDTLSPREREVAKLAAQGLTNAQIGKSLYLSSATAAHHVSTVMRKMGVTSRVALARKLTQLEAEATQ